MKFLDRILKKPTPCLEKVSENNALDQQTAKGDSMNASKNNVSILAFADLHHWDLEEIQRILDYKFDICVLLGDVPKDAIRSIVKIVGDKPIFAIPGNHDTWDMFEEFPIVDLHMKTDVFAGLCFSGFGGSLKYKDGPFAMHTQEECIELIKNLPPADILLSHDSKYGIFGLNNAHEGLQGITQYIEKNKISLNLCGHHHRPYKKGEGGCTTICVYRCAVIDYPKMTMKQIF